MDKPAFELRILGHTELSGPAPDTGDAILRQPKRLALLAYLAVATAQGFRRRDQVIGFFWPEMDQTQARTYLRKALYAIREDLGADVFVTRGEDELRVDQSKLWCDAVAISQRGKDEHWSGALSLYRGELLEGLFPEGVAQEFQEWLSEQRRALRQAAAHAAWECSRLEEDRGDRTAASVMARRARELDPDNEEGVRRLMGLLDRRGDRGGALRVYAEWQVRLLEEFGVEPDPETRKLARKIQAARKGESHETPPVVKPLPAAASIAAPTVPLTARAPRLSRTRTALATGALIAIIAVIAFLVNGSSPEGPTSDRSVAVVPFRVIGTPGPREIADAIAEELTTTLAADTTVTIRVIARGMNASVISDIPSLGRQLGVAYVVDGAVQRSGAEVRVSLRLLRVSDAAAVWAGSRDVADDEPAAIARRVASDAAPTIAKSLATASPVKR